MAHEGNRRARIRDAEPRQSRAMWTQHGRAPDRRRGHWDQAVQFARVECCEHDESEESSDVAESHRVDCV